jgi:PAS domain S-box-containing protein
LKTNISLLVLVIFIVSLIITLNVFFQNTYQSEIAEQFNRQQLLIAKSIANNLEDEMLHMESEMLSLAALISEGKVKPLSLEEFINYAHYEIREDMNSAIKIIDSRKRLRYSSHGESLTKEDMQLFGRAEKLAPGKVLFVDKLATERKIIMLTPIERHTRQDGALMVEVGIDDINRKFLTPIRVGIRGHAWMMDSDGTLLYHPTQPGMIGKNLYQAGKPCFECHKSFDVEKKILESGDIGFSSYIAPYGEDKLIAFSRVKLADVSWIVCVSIPYSEVTLSIRKSMKLHSMLVISIFMATLAGAFAIVMINKQRVKAEEKAKHLETQRQLEQEILQTKDYLESLLESTESKIMVIDRDMLVRTVNSAQLRLCNREKEEVIGRTFFEVFNITAGKDMEKMKTALEQCLEGTSGRMSNYMYRRNGEAVYLNVNINPLMIHGKIEGVILSSSNVTEEVNLKTKIQEYAQKLEEMVVKRTEELEGEKEKLDVIVSAIEAGICVLDNTDKKVIWTNNMLREWLGVKDSESVAAGAIYSEETFRSPIDRAVESGQMVQTVVNATFAGKTGYFQITANPLADSSGKTLILVLIQDITELKKMEERMMYSEKLSALARISAGVAHEIGNPLTSISSYVQILREMEHDDFTRESLDTIAKHIHRITDIVRQMSSFSRTKGSDLKHHDVRELVDMTLDLVKYDKRMKNIAVNVKIPEGLPKVVVDETQLIQVLVNIVLNAADAMASGGTLDISAGKVNEEVEICTEDTGSGIPVEHLEKIFDPFFTTKEKGTGLGLAVSYNIVKSYHGDIVVENRPGGGTIFRVRLPYHES